MSTPLIVVGASVRAAVGSARRAGFRTVAADLFTDLDLQSCGPATRIERYPHGLVDFFRSMQRTAWVYTGALENYPRLLDRIAAEHPLFGNAGGLVARVRRPEQLQETLARHGLLYPELSSGGTVRRRGSLSPNGAWLCKPYASAGGTGIRVWDPDAPPPATAAVTYLQRRIDGLPTSAVYVGAGGRAVLLGATRQLCGTDWAGASGFQYAGSIGPLPLDPPRRQVLQSIGDVLADQFGLVGLFGVDAVEDAEGIWVIEVNPRYTASVEILERSLAIHAVALHMAACGRGELPSHPSITGRCWGKVILFARRTTVVPAAFVRFALDRQATTGWPPVADVPAAGTVIGQGRPLVTGFAEGDDSSATYENLRGVAEGLYGRLEGEDGRSA